MQKAGASGTKYWINKRYVEADIVISLPTMKTHLAAGITGGVKNLGIGVTPMGQYSLLTDASASYDCTRGQVAGANSIDHSSPDLVACISRRSILPRTREEQDLVGISRRVSARQLMNVLTDTGALPQGGPVIDEDAHDGRVQSQAAETQNR